MDLLYEIFFGSFVYLSDDELYRLDENKVRRKVVKFKGYEELDYVFYGCVVGGMLNM